MSPEIEIVGGDMRWIERIRRKPRRARDDVQSEGRRFGHERTGQIAVADDRGWVVVREEQFGHSRQHGFGQAGQANPRLWTIQRSIELAKRRAHESGLAIPGHRIQTVFNVLGLQRRQARQVRVLLGRQQVVQQLRARGDPFGQPR